jgi:hypothetical protein
VAGSRKVTNSIKKEIARIKLAVWGHMLDVSPGALSKIVLAGLPEAAVKESTHRVERAIVNPGFVRPQDRVVINLVPAERTSPRGLPPSSAEIIGRSEIGLSVA